MRKRTVRRVWSLVNPINHVIEGMANDGIGPEVLEACKHAQEAMLGAAKRYELTKRMGLTGEGLQAVRELYEYHDLQRTSISLGEYEKSITKTMNRVRSKAPGVIEIATV